MHLRDTSLSILQQLKSLMCQLRPEEYSAPLPLLSENSIGKHIRHILEFFDQLLNEIENDILNYDNRKHDQQLEIDLDIAINKLNTLEKKLLQVNEDKDIWLETCYSKKNVAPVKVKTSILRELAYNIEHSIHHMAIIKIAVITVFSQVELPEDFGIAYSTIRYQNN